jgi:hypothetical protein
LDKLVGGHPALGAMMEHTQIVVSLHDRFLREAEKEMVKFEHQEFEFRRKERQERAAELYILALSSNLGTPDAR